MIIIVNLLLRFRLSNPLDGKEFAFVLCGMCDSDQRRVKDFKVVKTLTCNYGAWSSNYLKAGWILVLIKGLSISCLEIGIVYLVNSRGSSHTEVY